jgi:DNA-binding MarR family transcriptional regulator
MSDEELGMLVLRASTQVVDGIQQGVARRGFADVRPSHGFVLARVSFGDATVADVAEHLGVTKQAASQLVEQLVQRGYATRSPDPQDGRARLLALTDRGWACTRAATQAAGETVSAWRQVLGADAMAALQAALQAVVVPGRLRPAW